MKNCVNLYCACRCLIFIPVFGGHTHHNQNSGAKRCHTSLTCWNNSSVKCFEMYVSFVLKAVNNIRSNHKLEVHWGHFCPWKISTIMLQSGFLGPEESNILNQQTTHSDNGLKKKKKLLSFTLVAQMTFTNQFSSLSPLFFLISYFCCWETSFENDNGYKNVK